jgi:HAD superfamily hydrolase (TIGR01509 family)
MTVKGMLWDNDGVLVDSEHLFYAVNRDLLGELGVALSEDDFYRWYLASNCGAWHLVEGVSDARIAQWRQERNVRYTRHLLTEGNLAMAGIGAVVQACAARVPMGIVTSANRDHFDIIHGPLDLVPHFRFVLTAEDYALTKPSPEPYLTGLARLGIAAHECLVIEDSPRGLAAASAAGMRCIVLRHRLTRQCNFDGAYRVVDSVGELARELASLLGSPSCRL